MIYEASVHSPGLCSRHALVLRPKRYCGCSRTFLNEQHCSSSTTFSSHHLYASQYHCFHLEAEAELLRALPDKLWLQSFLMTLPCQLPAPFQCQGLPVRAVPAERNTVWPQSLQFTVQHPILKVLPSAVPAKVLGSAQTVSSATRSGTLLP